MQTPLPQPLIRVALLSCISVLTLSQSGFAETKGTPVSADKPVYVVDVQRVIDESQSGRSARAIVEEEAKKRESRLVDLKRDIEGSRADLEKQKSLLSPEAIEEKEAGLRKKEKDLARNFQDQDEELSKKNGVEVERLVRHIDRIVEKMVKDANYSFVIEKESSVVIYVDPKYDVTEKVISLLDKDTEKS